MSSTLAEPATLLGLAAALGGGLLIGLERERRKHQRGRGADREAAGIRSFTLAALGGGVAQALGQPLLVALGAALVATLVATAYWHSRQRQRGPQGDKDADPGLTTELALFVTYLVGVLAQQQPALGAAAAVVVAGLLAAREKLHRFATQALSPAELHDALLLAALALVLLPLMPATPPTWLAGVLDLAPRTLLLMVLLILALQAAGHVALRLFGGRAGLALAGLLSGFVSSTATIASMGARLRATPAQATPATVAAIWSSAATWLQALLMLLALAPAAAWAVLPLAVSGAGVALLVGAVLLGRGVGAAPGAEAEAEPASSHGPLRLREALAVVALLAAVSAAVGWAQQRFGGAGLLAGTALSALADAHAPVVALGALHQAGRVDSATVAQGVWLAVAANSLTRCAVAGLAGGWAYALRVGAALALALAAAGAWLLFR